MGALYLKTPFTSSHGLLGVLLIACAACSSSKSTTGAQNADAGEVGGTANGGSSGGNTDASGSSSGGAGAGGQSEGGTGGTETTGGSGGSAGSGGTTTTGGAGGSNGGESTGGGGAGGASGGSGGDGGSAGASGAPNLAGCSNHDYQLCIDFENGIDTNVWQGGSQNAIVTTDAAHGTHAYSLYANGAGTGGRLMSTMVGTIKDKVWARFYIHFKPGAPGGHGNIVAAYDQSGNWYEMGYQFDGMMGVWHGGGGEHPRRSMPYIVDRWYCVEAFFDGANAAMPKWYIDGVEAEYYEPVKADGSKVVEAGPTPTVATQFTRLEAGFTPYAPLGLKQPDTVGDQTETRVLTDLLIDDIAFDDKPIGCITP